MQVPVDIETLPQQPEHEVKAVIADTIKPPAQMSKPETIQEWHNGEGKYAGVKDALIEQAYRNTALDGSKGSICSITWAIGDSEEDHSILVRPDGQESLDSNHKTVGSEANLLAAFFAILNDQLDGGPCIFAGHYIGGFDLPFLFQRAVINRVPPPFDLGQHGRHGVDFYDTMTAWAGYKGQISLDDLCAALGIEIESPEGMEGSTVWDAYQAGQYDEIVQYNRADVQKVQAILRRLQFRA